MRNLESTAGTNFLTLSRMRAAAPFGLPERKHEFWERQIHAALGLLAKAGHVSTDELRREVEGLIDCDWSYYGKWALAIAGILREKGVITLKDLESEVGKEEEGDAEAPARFAPGQEVVVRDETYVTRWRRPHLRTPGNHPAALMIVWLVPIDPLGSAARSCAEA